jgi:hypothetical protein
MYSSNKKIADEIDFRNGIDSSEKDGPEEVDSIKKELPGN